MPSVVVEKCPVCDATKKSKLFACKDFYISHETFQLYQCDTCKFVFTQEVPDENEMGRYYESSDYVSHSDTKAGIMNSLYHWVRKIMLGRKAAIASKHQKTGQLLDIGCGTGYFLGAMQQKGWQVTGIEPSDAASLIARNKFGLTILKPSEITTLPDNYFNVITLWHVLEHLENLHEYMSQLSRLLKEDGRLVIALPNSASYDAKKYCQYWAGYDVPRHIWHFITPTFKLLSQKYGFEVTKIKRMPFDAFYVGILSEKYKGSKFALLKGMWTGVVAYCASLFDTTKSSSLIFILSKKK